MPWIRLYDMQGKLLNPSQVFMGFDQAQEWINDTKISLGQVRMIDEEDAIEKENHDFRLNEEETLAL